MTGTMELCRFSFTFVRLRLDFFVLFEKSLAKTFLSGNAQPQKSFDQTFFKSLWVSKGQRPWSTTAVVETPPAFKSARKVNFSFAKANEKEENHKWGFPFLNDR